MEKLASTRILEKRMARKEREKKEFQIKRLFIQGSSGNTINGGKGDKVGVFDFGNKYSRGGKKRDEEGN
ncbi:hypothetical protein GBA52_004543 [Prunus armeniaca]|nr:hypothetical protein GBA52_004543 [Prunus armeniaca]